MIYKIFEGILINSLERYFQKYGNKRPKHLYEGMEDTSSSTIVIPYADEVVVYSKGILGFREVKEPHAWRPPSAMFLSDIQEIERADKLWAASEHRQWVDQFCQEYGINCYNVRKPLLGYHQSIESYLKSGGGNGSFRPTLTYRHFLCLDITEEQLCEVSHAYHKTLIAELTGEHGTFYHRIRGSEKIGKIVQYLTQSHEFSPHNECIRVMATDHSVELAHSGVRGIEFKELGLENLTSEVEVFWVGYATMEEIIKLYKMKDVAIQDESLLVNYRYDAINQKLYGIDFGVQIKQPEVQEQEPALEPW